MKNKIEKIIYMIIIRNIWSIQGKKASVNIPEKYEIWKHEQLSQQKIVQNSSEKDILNWPAQKH